MTYEAALKAAAGRTSSIDGLPHLAIVCASLALVHAIDPRMLFDGAVRRGLTGAQLAKIEPLGLVDIMFAS